MRLFVQKEGPKIIYLIDEEIITEADNQSLNSDRIKFMDNSISQELKTCLSEETQQKHL